MHFFASTFHERTPVELLSSNGSKLRPPVVMALVPHFGTHFRHAFQARIAELGDTRVHGPGRLQRKVSENLGNTAARPHLGIYQEAVSARLPQARVDSQWDAERGIVGRRNRVVSQPSNELRHHPQRWRHSYHLFWGFCKLLNELHPLPRKRRKAGGWTSGAVHFAKSHISATRGKRLTSSHPFPAGPVICRSPRCIRDSQHCHRSYPLASIRE